MLVEEEVELLLLLILLMCCQYVDQISTNLGLGIYVSDPEIQQYIGYPIKLTLYDKVLSEVLFVVLFGVGVVFVTFKGPCTCHSRPLSTVAVLGD